MTVDRTLLYYPFAVVAFAAAMRTLDYALPDGNLYWIAGLLVALVVGHVVGEKTMRALY